jgi:hypothetical protein
MTPAHRRAFREGLERRGIDVDRALTATTLRLLDARESLAQFREHGRVIPERFAAFLDAHLAPLERLTPNVRIHAFGEMVDLLCQDGDLEAALELERFWNAAVRRRSLSLTCAYAMATFPWDDETAFERVRRAHAAVLPPNPGRDEDCRPRARARMPSSSRLRSR